MLGLVAPGLGMLGGQAGVAAEVLTSSDPRIGERIGLGSVGLSNNAADWDREARLFQSFLDLAATAAVKRDQAPLLLPGKYNVNPAVLTAGEFRLANTVNNKPVYLSGCGGKSGWAAPTVVHIKNDLGAGKLLLRPMGQTYFHIEGVFFRGSGSSAPMGGTSWQMGGILLNCACGLRDVSVNGFLSGVEMAGDHLLVDECTLEGNGFGMNVFKGDATSAANNTQGDIVFHKTRMGNQGMAAIGVPKSNFLAGAKFIDTEVGSSPYSVLRYDDGLGTTVSSWLNGVHWLGDVASERVTGFMADHVGDGASANNLTFDNGVPGVYDSRYIWPGKVPTAVWQNSGGIEIEFLHSFPPLRSLGSNWGAASGTILPAFDASTVSVRYRGHLTKEGTVDLYGQGRRFIKPMTPCRPPHLRGSRFGLPGGYEIVPFAASAAVSQGELLVRSDAPAGTTESPWEWVKKCNSNTARVAGVAAHTIAGQGCIEAYVAGRKVPIKNSSATDIAAGTTLVPHSGGGVQAGTGPGVGTALELMPAGQVAFGEFSP